MNARKLIGARLWAFFLLTATTVTGCGDGAGLVPVEGRVTVDGKPLEQVKVLFYVPGGGPETNFTAITDADGRFTLTSLDGARSGAAPGAYSVSLTTNFWAPDALETDPPPQERIPPQYREHQFEVPNDGTTDAVFEVPDR